MSAIVKMTSGPLAGFSAIDFDFDRFAQFKGYCEDNFDYQMGGKCSNLGTFPPTYELNGAPCDGCDCSGFVRSLLYYATEGGLLIPDGTWAEDPWFGPQGFKRTSYVNCAVNDNLVRVAIHRPGGRGGDPTGHIWLCVHQHTVESYGGNGPGERPWALPLLVDLVDDCFVLGPLV